jgi:hypothetical protein
MEGVNLGNQEEQANTQTETTKPRVDPNQLLFTLLKEHKLKLSVSALSQENPFIENKGFVLTEKPLLVVSAAYEEATQ